MKKSQTSTEYLIILAVVIVIALIVVGVLGGIPGIGGGVSESSSRLQLASLDVGVTSYMQNSHSTSLELSNNNPTSIRIDSMTINNKKCSLYPYKALLGIGEKRKITCYGVIGLDEGSRFDYNFNLTYTDMDTSAQYTIEPDIKLVDRIAQGSELHTGQIMCSYCNANCGVAWSESWLFSSGCNSSHYGQDAYEDGIAKAFTDVGENIVKDEHTDLFWTTNESTNITRASAISHCENLIQGSYDDWRLPNIVELTTVLNTKAETNPSPEQSWAEGYYWSSTSQIIGATTYIWRLMMGGDWFIQQRQSLDSPQNSVCVRGTTTGINLVDSTKHFVDVGDGTVIDIDTGVIWEKELGNTDLMWQQAVDYCDNLNKSGYFDWRLPTMNEVASLVDYGSNSSSNYHPTAFGNPGYYMYWTATGEASSGNDAFFAFTADLTKGEVSSDLKYFPFGYLARCVRDR